MKCRARAIVFALAAAAVLAARCGPGKTTKGAEEPAAQPLDAGDKPEKAADKEGVTVEGAVTCSPVVEGKACGFSLTVTNHTGDIVIVSSMTTNRSADRIGSLLGDEYGSLHEDEQGNLYFNQLAQMATPKVFFGRDLLVLPGDRTELKAVTRFFGDPRNVTVGFYRVSASDPGRHIFVSPMQTQPTGALMAAAATMLYVPLAGIDEIEKVQGRFVLWNSQDLETHEATVGLDPEVKEAAFSLKKAGAMIKDKTGIKETTYCDTFSAWIFSGADETWFVREGGAEKFGPIDPLVFEKIDEKAGKDVRFKVPEKVFAKTYKLEDGDGMYTIGKFLTASGDAILDVLRMLEPNGLSCSVTFYFFTSWYLEIE